MKSISRSILRLAVPNAVANITVPLLGLIDTAIAGRVAGDAGIGAIALGGAVFSLLYWNCSFLRMATSGMVGQSYGKRDWGSCKRLLTRGIVLALAISALLLIFRRYITGLAVWVLSADNVFALTEAAATYVSIRIWAAPAVLLGYAMQGWMVGMQRSKLPMTVAISSNVVNIIFSYLFAVIMDMGIEGIALGTVVAQYTGLLIWVAGTATDKELVDVVREKRGSIAAEETSYWSFVKKNIDIFLRTIVLVGVHCAMTIFSARIGQTELAMTACMMHFFMLISYITDALAYAAEALTGKYIGEGNRVEMRQMMVKLGIWGVILCVCAAYILSICSSQIFNLLGASQEVATEAQEYLWWIIIITSLSIMAFIEDGVMLGAANTRAMVGTVWASGIIGAIITWAIWETDVMWALWIGFGVFMISRGLLLLPFSLSLCKK